jgi:hypothetical protein
MLARCVIRTAAHACVTAGEIGVVELEMKGKK